MRKKRILEKTYIYFVDETLCIYTILLSFHIWNVFSQMNVSNLTMIRKHEKKGEDNLVIFISFSFATKKNSSFFFLPIVYILTLFKKILLFTCNFHYNQISFFLKFIIIIINCYCLLFFIVITIFIYCDYYYFL